MYVRPATADDVHFLTDVVIDATRDQGRFPDGFDEREFRAGFVEWTNEQVAGEVADSTTYVVEVGGEPVGRQRVLRSGHHVELAGLQLLPRFQGRGIGTELVRRLMDEAVAAGVPLELGVEKDNPRALAFYERLGLVRVAETDSEIWMRWLVGATGPGVTTAWHPVRRPSPRPDL